MTDLSKSVQMKRVASRLQVRVPFNQEFVKFAHSRGARWKKRTSMWSFQKHHYPDVARTCNELFGCEYEVRNQEDTTSD